jgi:hypothetical protein
MKLPSQLECLSMISQLEKLEEGKTIEGSASIEKDAFPKSGATWLLSQLKSTFNIKSPSFYPFPCSSKEMFSWVERNNQISEETLNSLVYEEKKIEEMKQELKEYCEDIPCPKQIELTTETPIDYDLLIGEETQKGEARAPKCFLWKWGKFSAFIAPQEMDVKQIGNFKKELKELSVTPDAFILMPYSSNPSTEIDEYFGGEIWHTFPPTEPLFWEETKFYLEAIRCQENFEKSLKENKTTLERI